MVFLLSFLGFVAIVAGMFGLGLAVPVRDTSFGAAVLVSASVAMTGGFILVGLAAAVSELRRVLRTGMRQTRLPERWEGERSQGAGRRTEPRLGVPGSHGAAVDDVIPTKFDVPEARERLRAAPPEERLPSEAGNTQEYAASSLNFPPASERAGSEPRRTPAAPLSEKFDRIRSSEHRMPDREGPEQGAETAPRAGTAAGEVKSPPLSPAETAAPAGIRPVRILKSGMIDDVAYTLFSDGSIETQTPDGALRFASIEEFRKHLEKSAG
jgi:hypothetical protein